MSTPLPCCDHLTVPSSIRKSIHPSTSRDRRPTARLFLYSFFVLCLAYAGLAQEPMKPRIAVFPFDDRTSANKDMNIGTKVADLLISKLASNPSVTVYDREYVDRLLKEKNLKYDPNYDSASAAKSGLMGTVDVVISGQVSAFNANTNEKTVHQVVRTVHEIDGAVALKVTARLLSVEKGSILMAPTAANDQNGVLAQDNSYMKVPLQPKNGMGYDTKSEVKNQDQGLRKLVDEAAEQVAMQLSTQILPVAAMVKPVLTAPPPPPPTRVVASTEPALKAKFVGIVDGMAYMDKGSTAGIRAGDTFLVRRNTKTALKDGSGKPIMSHKPVCTLVIQTVDEASASGTCTPDPAAKGPDAMPHAGDEVIPPPK